MSAALRRRIAAGASLLLACAGAEPQRPPAPRFLPPAPVLSGVPARPEALPFPAALARSVAALRGLPAPALPSVLPLPAAVLVERALDEVDRVFPPQVQAAHAHLLRRLGLVPPGFAFRPALAVALRGRLRALYVGEPPTILIDRALSSGLRRAALAHELVHALQDRWFGIWRRLAYEPGGWDRQSVLHALSEADACAVAGRLGGSAAEEPFPAPPPDEPGASAPGVLLRSLAAAYVDAEPWVERLVQDTGFSAVNAALRDPPRSSHELLHPEPLHGAAPSVDPLPPRSDPGPPAPGWHLAYGDVLGEQTLRTVLEEWLPDTRARRLASSWAADRVSVFRRGAATALVWQLVAEGPGAAQQIAQTFAAGLGVRRASSGPPPVAMTGSGSSPAGMSAAAPSARQHSSSEVGSGACAAHPDGGVIGVGRQGRVFWFASLAGDESAEVAACAGLRMWLSPALRRAAAHAPVDSATRVSTASPVAWDPAATPGGNHPSSSPRQGHGATPASAVAHPRPQRGRDLFR